MNPFYRQNDKEALTYLKASYHCMTRERNIKYFVIFTSFFICLCGILNKYIPIMFKNFPNILVIQAESSTWINLASGVILLLSMLLSFYTFRMHLEGTCLQERYDCYVFNIDLNQSIMRPISQTIIDIYASKVKRKDEKFLNMYYDSPDDINDDFAHYDNINKQLHSDYRLYMSVQSFFFTVWIGFGIIVLGIALSFDDKFINTLINILFPSLSAITIIATSWFNFRQQIKHLQNDISVIDNIQNSSDSEKKLAATNSKTLRMLQDGLFNFRVSAFVIPNFLIRLHEKQLAKESWSCVVRKSSDLITNLNVKKNAQTLNRRLNKNNNDNIVTLYLPTVNEKPFINEVDVKQRSKSEMPIKETFNNSAIKEVAAAKFNRQKDTNNMRAAPQPPINNSANTSKPNRTAYKTDTSLPKTNAVTPQPTKQALKGNNHIKPLINKDINKKK